MNESLAVLTIHKTGSRIAHSAGLIETLSLKFERENYIHLPQLLSEELLNELHDEIEHAEWEQRVHEQIGVEDGLRDKGINGVMNFLMNDASLFRILEQITGCGSIGSFSGRVYRMIPEAGHYDSWHGDVGEHRLLALSMNLGKKIYSGGILQLRTRLSEGPPVFAPNNGFGDAILFRIAPHLEHRVSNLEGNIPKIAFAGWFRSEPDFFSMLRNPHLMEGEH